MPPCRWPLKYICFGRHLLGRRRSMLVATRDEREGAIFPCPHPAPFHLPLFSFWYRPLPACSSTICCRPTGQGALGSLVVPATSTTRLPPSVVVLQRCKGDLQNVLTQVPAPFCAELFIFVVFPPKGWMKKKKSCWMLVCC